MNSAFERRAFSKAVNCDGAPGERKKEAGRSLGIWAQVVDLEPYLRHPSRERGCDELARALAESGALAVRDPRVATEDNERFLDLMEGYFADRTHEEKLSEARPELSYQVGATPELTEVPRVLTDWELRREAHAAGAHIPASADPKWRYFWRVGRRPQRSSFEDLNAADVVPKGLPGFEEVMQSFGHKLLATCETVAEMVALGLGIPPEAMTGKMEAGPHLLAPTGADLEKYGKKGQVLAAYHSDLNLLTAHGKARFPGLAIWLRDGSRVSVQVPQGHVLIQAGKQLEYLTGGYIHAGKHEVVVDSNSVDAINRAKEERRRLWRVSSTFFAHCNSDAVLEPLGSFRSLESLNQYPPIKTGDFVRQELQAISLRKPAICH